MPSGDLMPSGTPIPPEDTIKEEEDLEGPLFIVLLCHTFLCDSRML